jgi:hypothetical protein
MTARPLVFAPAAAAWRIITCASPIHDHGFQERIA